MLSYQKLLRIESGDRKKEDDGINNDVTNRIQNHMFKKRKKTELQTKSGKSEKFVKINYRRIELIGREPSHTEFLKLVTVGKRQ